jgi:hypothetical protein
VTRTDAIETVIAIAAKTVRTVITIAPATTDDVRLDPANVTIDAIVNLDTATMVTTDTSAHVTRPIMETTRSTRTSADTDTTGKMNVRHPKLSSRGSQVP